MDLAGKTAIVTGATSGIGYAIAEVLAKSNCNVIINGFASMTEIANIVGYFSALGTGKVMHCASDMTKLEDIESLVQFTRDNFGAADILVNNAGIQHVSSVESFEVSQWDQIIMVNLSAPFHLMRLILPWMRQKGWGRIINIASTHGLVASPHKSAYVAAKHGLVGLTKTVALETARESITCNVICPGWVWTPLVEKQVRARAEREGADIETVKHELLAEKQPSLAFVKAEDIGAFALFLVSDAAAQITGASLSMDGGWTAQ